VTASPDDLLLDQTVQGQVRGDPQALTGHRLLHRHAAQEFPKGRLCGGGRGGILEEPADERHPDPPEDVAAQRREGAQRNQPECQKLARVGCRPGCPVETPRPSPDHGPQHPSTIERKPGEQVEERHREVDPREPRCHRR